MRRARFVVMLLVASALVVLAAAPVLAVTIVEQRVSPLATHFPQNKQNESPMAVNPVDPLNAISGANDEIEEPDCTPPSGGPSSCPFVPGINTTGVYVTTNGGATWTQQILHWNSSGLQSDGDPTVAFGPKPDGHGGFTYANGARAYFASLAGPLGGCLGCELNAVAWSDDKGATWSDPVVVSKRANPVDFNDKEAIWADANPSSPHFGTVYVSWTLFTGNPLGNFGEANVFSPEPIVIAHSTDGGRTWSRPVKLTPSVNNAPVGGRQGSTVRTGPDGTVYVFWDGARNFKSAILGARSSNGGVSFTRPFLVSFKSDNPSPMPGTSFRNNSFPMADVDSSGNVYVTWTNYDTDAGHGRVMLAKSTDHGRNWSVSAAADVAGRSPFYPGVATNGSDVFIGFAAIDDVPAGTAPGAGVVAYDSYYVLSTDGGASFGAPVKISAASSDPDAATTNGLTAQFLGDYNGAAAGSDGSFWFSWTDTRNGATCAAIDAWRASGFSTPEPNIYDSCPPDFGNSDIFVAKVTP
ncbi:MAG TPA: sialidase family protein [Actinomycetota bacterium]|nr:sialidase family protein [Actinomycetota bacterium]